MIKILFLLLNATILLSQMKNHTMNVSNVELNKLSGVKILDAKELEFKSLNGVDVKELSALAYKDNVLYALGDKGVLFHFYIQVQNKRIKKLSLLKALRLKNEDGTVLKKSHRDSEGLSFIENNLLISFEKKPRVHQYSILGVKIKKQKIHKDLQIIKKYRSKNKALEAVAYNKEYGVVTAPEKSLVNLDKKLHTLYSKTKKWIFPALGSISGLEFMGKHKIMILQRKQNKLTRSRVTILSSLNLKNSNYKVLAKLDSVDGWNIDNFEGLTRIDKDTYLIISDDNNSFFQKTLLVLFEVIKN